MTAPVPGYPVTVAYGIRGTHWRACGIHTGVDIAAPTGARVVAARGGVARHVNYGAAFGRHQLAIVAADGSEDFYAHMSTRRPADGARVRTGETVGTVGADGNATGPHLHFERHTVAGRWSCSTLTNPAPSLAYTDTPTDWFTMATKQELRDVVEQVIDSRIDEIAGRVNRTLGDFDAKGRPAGPNKDKPQLAAQYIRQIRRLVDTLADR